ncbi:MAG: SpoIIIAH-like family protein [Oscillospiraceae bacterium]|nr:SpoIIIAH-like family protein [Oscillospiraceae bacterium]MBR3556674.1 SpoIIIAH-like family protein [Oscillospiraceae bacterium]
MKILRRNAIIIAVILFVCAAVYLNWAYNRQEAELGDDAAVLADAGDGLWYETPTAPAAAPAPAAAGLGSEVADYFTSARLNRQKARDSAISTLREAAETESASQEAVDEALGAITAMAGYTVSEAEIEALITAKGFQDCIVFLSADSVIVAVPAPAEGLGDSAVSRITDIVLQETNLHTEQIKIIGVK